MAVTDLPETTSPGELIRWSVGRLNAQDLASVRRLWTSDTHQRFPDRECRGPDEIAQYFQDGFDAIGGFHLEIVNLSEHGAHVYMHWHLTGVHQGVFSGIAATGKPLAIDGIDHFTVRDGKVVSNFVIFDQLQYALQVGMAPPEGSPADRAVKAAFNAKSRLAAKLRARSGK